MKVHFIIANYERPNMVTIALKSILDCGYQDWFVTFNDDSCNKFGFDSWARFDKIAPGKSIYVKIGDTQEEKERNHSRHGEFLNRAILNVDSELVIVLCDDDAIVPGTVGPLVEYFDKNIHVQYAYTKIIPYDPMGPYPPVPLCDPNKHTLNRHNGPIVPCCSVDSSQVTFRRSFFTHHGLRYLERANRNLDAALFDLAYKKIGSCHEAGQFLQYKGSFSNQLGNRPDTWAVVDREVPVL